MKILVLGQAGVGKTALTVRFITRRFIGDYDPTLEKIYTHKTCVDGELITFEILDSAGQDTETTNLRLQENIRWAESYVLMYSVNDKCSFDECTRLKFLITHMRRRRKLSYGNVLPYPVTLVGNKTDQIGDRMVSCQEGKLRSLELGCHSFHEISVRESYEEVVYVFEDLLDIWRAGKGALIMRADADSEVRGMLNTLSRRGSPAAPRNLPERYNRNLRSKSDNGQLLSGILSSQKGRELQDSLAVPSLSSPPQRRMSVSLQGSLSMSYEVCS